MHPELLPLEYKQTHLKVAIIFPEEGAPNVAYASDSVQEPYKHVPTDIRGSGRPPDAAFRTSASAWCVSLT